MAKSLKGQLSQDDIHTLNDWNANLLSRMFDTEVANVCSLPVVDGKVTVKRPAYNDEVVITEAEREVVAKAIAYSTLNQAAFQVKTKRGDLAPLYAMGFSDAQIENSGANYSAITKSASTKVFRILN